MFALTWLVMATQPCGEGQVRPEGEERCGAVDEAGEAPRPRDPATRPPLKRGVANFVTESTFGSIGGSFALGASAGLLVNPLRSRRGSLGFSLGLWAVTCFDGCGFVGLPLALRGGLKFGVFKPMVRVGLMPAMQFVQTYGFNGYAQTTSMFGAYFTVGTGVMIAVGRGGFWAGFEGCVPLAPWSRFYSPQGHGVLGYLF